MGKLLTKFKEELSKISKRDGVYIKLENVDNTDKDFIRDCQMICLEIAPYSAQEKPDEILGIKVPQPVIGASLYVDGVLYCSSRSGKRIGDHAEFTIIEEAKNDDVDFSKSVIFTSLEPCTKHSRSPWSTSCSDYILQVGIPEVYFGCLDANPAITGIGVKRLLEHCIVHSFDNDLVNKSIKLNESFFKHFDSSVDGKILKDVIYCVKHHLDEFAVKLYLRRRIDKSSLSYDEWTMFFIDMINNHSIVPGKINKYDVTPDFAIAFYQEPSIVVPNYSINIYNKDIASGVGLNRGSSKYDFKSGSLISVIANVGDKKQNIYSLLQHETLKAKNSNLDYQDLIKLVFANNEAGRELLINAFVHANYANGKAGIDMVIENNNLIIYNPVVSKTILKDLEDKEKRYSLPQNPRLMQFLYNAGLVEARHLGMDMLFETNMNPYSFTSRSGIPMLVTTIMLKR